MLQSQVTSKLPDLMRKKKFSVTVWIKELNGKKRFVLLFISLINIGKKRIIFHEIIVNSDGCIDDADDSSLKKSLHDMPQQRKVAYNTKYFTQSRLILNTVLGSLITFNSQSFSIKDKLATACPQR